VTVDPGIASYVDDGADRDYLEQAEQINALGEIGRTGLKRTAGYVDEEFLPVLKGTRAVKIYREMADNDPLVGALLFTITQLVRNVEWTVQPGGKSKEDEEISEFIKSCMDDMEHTWADFIGEALTCLIYGWSWHEIVYKKCMGPWEEDPIKRSKHNDGKIRWRKLPIRSQDTLLRWVFDDRGDVQAMMQMAPPKYQTVAVPYNRSLLFRFSPSKGNPEGRSLLRNAYRPWYLLKRLQESEAVGLERDLAGLPIVKVPAAHMKAKAGTEQYKQVQAMRQLVKNVRRNESEGVVFPADYDPDTKQALYSFELLSSGGSRQFNTDAIIRRYEERILMSVLADFILVGHQGGGSYSLHIDKTGIFRSALNSLVKSIAETLNRHAVPKLLSMNGWRPETLPEFVPGDVDAPDLAQLSSFMTSMGSLGVSWFPDPDLEDVLRDIAKLPKLDPDRSEQLRQEQLASDATRFAQRNSEYAQAKLTESDPSGAMQEAARQSAQGAVGLSDQGASSSTSGSKS